MLSSITWEDATRMTGCYAINAAQDGGQCRPCTNHVEQVTSGRDSKVSAGISVF